MHLLFGLREMEIIWDFHLSRYLQVNIVKGLVGYLNNNNNNEVVTAKGIVSLIFSIYKLDNFNNKIFCNNNNGNI